MKQTSSLIVKDLSASVASLKQSAQGATQIALDERATIRQSFRPISEKAKLGAAKLAAAVDAHSAMVSELMRPDEDPWQTPRHGRDHTDYSNLDSALTKWNTLRGTMLPFLRRVDAIIERLVPLPEYERSFEATALQKVVENNVEAAAGAEKLLSQITLYAGRVATREAARVAKAQSHE